MQVGLAEMRRCVAGTGGYAVQTDSFGNPVFRESARRLFTKPDERGFLATCSSATVEVCGIGDG